MDLISHLRRLSRALPGDGVLYLPVGLSASEALQTIRAALQAVKPPPAGRTHTAGKTHGGVRIHIDGAARGNPGPAGIGVVIIGPAGKIVDQLHRGIGEATNNVAEYRALLFALDRAQALKYTDIEVFSDSELLVRQVQGRYQVKHPVLKELYAEAKDRIGTFRRFAIQHVPREQNAEADALANRGIDEAHRQGCLEEGADPDSLRLGGKA